MAVIALTPIAPGTVLAPFTLGIPRLVSELPPSVKVREANINLNRARLQEMFVRRLFPKYEFALLLDSDVVIGTDALDKLMAAWMPGKTPCAVTKGSMEGHVVCACSLIHRTDYEKVDYLSDLFRCQCTKLPGPFYVPDAIGEEI